MRYNIDEYIGIYSVIGPPGTGKTTFLADRVEKWLNSYAGPLNAEHSPVLICSLTRAAAAEIASRTPDLPKAAVATIHAHGFRAQGSPELIAKEDLHEWSAAHPQFALTNPQRDNDELEVHTSNPGEFEHEMYHLYRHQMLPRNAWSAQIASFADKWEAFKADIGKIDFTDQVEGALNLPPPLSPRIIVVDEAQDTSRLSYALLRKWAQDAGAMILTGDPYQALYVWAGADPDAMTDPNIPDSHQGILKQSYRIPALVHEMAVSWARQLSTYFEMEYHPRDEEGSVSRSDGLWHQPDAIIDEAEDIIAQGKSVMICGACNYLMGPTVAALRERLIPFANPWRLKNGSWNPLHTRATGISVGARVQAFLSPRMDDDGTRHFWTWRELSHWTKMTLASDFLVRGARKHIDDMAEKCPYEEVSFMDVTRLFLSNEGLFDWLDGYMRERTDEQDGLKWLGSILQKSHQHAKYAIGMIGKHGTEVLDAKPRLYVGTMHSFKGAEADHVFILPDLSSRWFREYIQSTEARDATIRTYYVGITRAKEAVHLCQPAGRASVNLLNHAGSYV